MVTMTKLSDTISPQEYEKKRDKGNRIADKDKGRGRVHESIVFE
jgi:hypothetical protein